MSRIRLHKWVFDALCQLYPGRYFSRRLPAIRPKRRPVAFDMEQLGERAAPTAIMAVDPVTASLVSFASLHEPLPPAGSVPIAVGQAASLSTDRLGDLPAEKAYFAMLASRFPSAAGQVGNFPPQNNSPLSPGGSALVQRAVSGGSPAAFLSTISGAHIAPNLEPLANAQTPFVDPLADFIPLKNKPILSSGGEFGARSKPGALATGTGAGGSIGGSGSSAPGANTSQGGYFDLLPPSNPFGSSLSLPPGALTANSTPGADATRLASPVANAPGSPTGPLTPDTGPVTPGTGNPNPEHKKKPDPLWVLDANKAIVVTPGTPESEFSNTAMDLRMQVSGATVNSYSWDLTSAPDTTGVSGSSTYNLTFSWSSFTGAARTDTIVAKETPQGGSQVTQTLTFLVAGTNSSAWSTPPTTSTTWPNVLTPDALTTMQATQAVSGCG